MTFPRASSKSVFIAIALIAGVGFLAYSNTFSVPFNFDDLPNITQNPNIQIRPLSWDSLERLVKNTFAGSIRVFSFFTLALIIILVGSMCSATILSISLSILLQESSCTGSFF
jgi:hypothetical protein